MKIQLLRFRAPLYAAIAAMATSVSLAQSGAAPGATWDTDPDALLVSYLEVWAQIADQDRTPLIRIFGDGRVVVHYPVYSPKAGEYELQLTPQALDNLLSSLLAKGLASIEQQTVQQMKALEEQRLRTAARDKALIEKSMGVPLAQRTPELFMVADDSTAVFGIYLTGYQASGNPLGATVDIDRTLSWHGLGTDAERYPGIEPIQQLREAELELRALLDRADLRRIR